MATSLSLSAPGVSYAQALEFAAEPSQDDFKAGFPERAHREHMSGEAFVLCHHEADGQLSHCNVQGETPAGYGFGAAAASLAAKYRLRMDGPSKPPWVVPMPMFFKAPGPAPPARPAAFQEATGRFAWLAPAGPYWPERALRMAVGGRARIDCRIGDKDRLTNCRPAFDEPVGIGFLDAVLKMAERGWMTAGPKPEGAPDPADGYWRFEVAYPAKDLCDEPGSPVHGPACRKALESHGYR